MKRYLLTWYGITDMKAALGFEEFGGPVLGALRTGDYTDALVLAYTDPTKVGPVLLRSQERWSEEISAAQGAGKTPAWQEQLEAVDAFANTRCAPPLPLLPARDSENLMHIAPRNVALTLTLGPHSARKGAPQPMCHWRNPGRCAVVGALIPRL